MLQLLPPDIVDSIVICAILGDGKRKAKRRRDPDVRALLICLRCVCCRLRDASSLQSIVRRCLSEPSVLEDILSGPRREALHRFLRASGGYALAVQAFLKEIGRLRAKKTAVPLPIVATICQLCGRLFAQISAYPQAEELLLSALAIETSQQGAKCEEATTLLTLSEMLRGSVSACQDANERRQFALRGMKYSRECFAICKEALGKGDLHGDNARRSACASALHLLGYHCAEFASGAHAHCYFEQAIKALSYALKIFTELDDDEMTATSLQDLGLCYYYQHKYV